MQCFNIPTNSQLLLKLSSNWKRIQQHGANWESQSCSQQCWEMPFHINRITL